jgi:hypothetical protein
MVARLGAADPAALARLRRVVGARRARIALDDEVIDVRWTAGGLQVTPAGDAAVEGEGATDRQTVLDLLDGHLEVHDAILDGRLAVTGGVDAVERMFLAIEILLDGGARTPAMQALADEFRADPRSPTRRPSSRHEPASASAAERELLARLGLLP